MTILCIRLLQSEMYYMQHFAKSWAYNMLYDRTLHHIITIWNVLYATFRKILGLQHVV